MREHTRKAPRRQGLAVGLLLLLGTAHAQTTPSYVELILDASGSMFTRLDGGQTRIAAAQAVLNDLIGRLPADPALNVGLRLYGARTTASETGACQDSVLTLPMKGIDRTALLQTVNQTRPKGATPIAYSLTQAANDFPTTAGKKLIVLVTDGQESCRGDLKAALAAFKDRGIEVDLRIIGIDLDARAQQSFTGVGTFVNARSIPELASALGSAVQTVAPPTVATVPVTVTLTSGGQPVASGPTVTFTGSAGGAGTPLTNSGGTYGASVLPGGYTATVKTATDTQTFGGLSVSVGAANTFTFDVSPVGGVTLTVTPTQPIAGGKLSVAFSGAPAGAKNWVTVARKTDADPVYLDWAYVQGASGTLDLNVPDDENEYEARYHLANPDGSTRIIGRSAPFTPKRQGASLSAPATAQAGGKIEVKWQGPNNDGDYVTVVPKGADVGAYTDYFYTRAANPGTLSLPLTPGDYELRYSNDKSVRVLATLPLTLTSATYTLQAPASAVAGSAVQVKWQGPNNDGDYVTIVPKGAPVGQYTTYFYTRDGNPGTLKTPAAPGDYELRYSSEHGTPNPTLASVPLTLTGTTYTLSGPASTSAGSEIQVKWTGPNNSGDYITIVPKGAPVGTYTQYFYTKDANPGKLKVPFAPGEYELRYSTEGQSPNPTLATMPLTIKSSTYSFTAPKQGKAGSTIQIKWAGPNNPGEYITIVKKGAPVGSYLNYTYTRDGNPVTLRLPDEPGEYELRYSTEAASPNPTLYSTPFTVTK
ncbi:VWA domain-containing protein [Deinococcus sp. KSM4-11]|uniref:vWA domain-containing protein n=1 Tax=Deinococcus sp. KSM4-11 TaxID=2568654 RepID=UPI0010A3440F|nr:VWA domain-containing protein [Deinococcus sp. KSM4-11]THF85756.1 VWA domain-containing protein [Deinococcus sp. KSM4-11]